MRYQVVRLVNGEIDQAVWSKALSSPLLEVAQRLPHKLHAHLQVGPHVQDVASRNQANAGHLFHHGPHLRDVLSTSPCTAISREVKKQPCFELRGVLMLKQRKKGGRNLSQFRVVMQTLDAR